MTFPCSRKMSQNLLDLKIKECSVDLERLEGLKTNCVYNSNQFINLNDKEKLNLKRNENKTCTLCIKKEIVDPLFNEGNSETPTVETHERHDCLTDEKSILKKEVKCEIENHDNLEDVVYSDELITKIKEEKDEMFVETGLIDQESLTQIKEEKDDSEDEMFDETELIHQNFTSQESLTSDIKIEIQEHEDLNDQIYHNEVSHFNIFFIL